MNAYALALLNQAAVRAHSEGRAPARSLRTCALAPSTYHAPAAPVPLMEVKPETTLSVNGYTKRGWINTQLSAYLAICRPQFTLLDVVSSLVRHGYSGCAESVQSRLCALVKSGQLTATATRGRNARVYTKVA